MRISSIKIGQWRHFSGIEIVVPESAAVVCLVGANGTGKSQILEVIGAAAQRIGLSAGFSGPRGDVFHEAADVEVIFQVAKGVFPQIDDGSSYTDQLREVWNKWDRSIAVKITPATGFSMSAGGNVGQLGVQLANQIANLIRQSSHVHYLMLDADRAYPRLQVQIHQLGEAFQTDWIGQAKGRSFDLTKNLYEEWFRYLIGTEGQESNRHVQAIRRARERGEPEPAFVDKMAGYRDSIRSVLPHLLFTGIDPANRQVLFDATGTSLTFDQLSGGEREIAFLVGQIERFGLRRGLLLVDEPELHLNNDLLRGWIGFLKSTVEQGQIWLASHSIEVVEVTGKDATFVLERKEETRKVVQAIPVGAQPVLATLSRAVGSPAFSVSNVTFLVVEGEPDLGEQERFQRLYPGTADVRYLESGSCQEVIRRSEALRQLAEASGEPLKIGGIVDKDWRSSPEVHNLRRSGVYVLEVHEVENFFLHPSSVRAAMTAISQDASTYDAILRELCDARAGTWIFDSTRTVPAFADLPESPSETRTLVHNLTWTDFDNIDAACSQIVATLGSFTADQRSRFHKRLVLAARVYSRVRDDEALWKRCEGKEILRSLPSKIGLSDVDALEKAISGVWARDFASVPAELIALRRFVDEVRHS